MMAKRKEILALALAMLPAAAFGLGACSFAGVHTPGKNPGEITNPGENTEQQFQATVDEVNGILSDAKESLNFTVEQNDADGKTTSKFAKDKSSVTEDGKTTYFSTAEGNNFVYSYKNNEWEKNYTNQTTKKLADAVLGDLQSIDWTELNGSKLQGTMSNQSVQAETVAGGVFYTFHDGSNINLTAVNATEVALPNENEKADPTVDPEKDTSDLLYNEVNGKKQYNLPLIKQTIQNWFKETDYYTKNIKFGGIDAKLEDIVYLNINKDKVRFGSYVVEGGKKEFQDFKFSKKFTAKFSEIETVSDFTSYLNENKSSLPIDIDGAPTMIEPSITQQDLEEIWPNIRDRIEKIGIGVIGEEKNKTDKYRNAEVIDEYPSYVEELDGVTIGDNLGFIQRYGIHYFLRDRVSGETWELSVGVSSKTANGYIPLDNVKNNVKNSWIIPGMSDKKIELVDRIEKTKTTNSYSKIDLYQSNRENNSM